MQSNKINDQQCNSLESTVHFCGIFAIPCNIFQYSQVWGAKRDISLRAAFIVLTQIIITQKKSAAQEISQPFFCVVFKRTIQTLAANKLPSAECNVDSWYPCYIYHTKPALTSRPYFLLNNQLMHFRIMQCLTHYSTHGHCQCMLLPHRGWKVRRPGLFSIIEE